MHANLIIYYFKMRNNNNESKSQKDHRVYEKLFQSGSRAEIQSNDIPIIVLNSTNSHYSFGSK